MPAAHKGVLWQCGSSTASEAGCVLVQRAATKLVTAQSPVQRTQSFLAAVVGIAAAEPRKKLLDLQRWGRWRSRLRKKPTKNRGRKNRGKKNRGKKNRGRKRKMKRRRHLNLLRRVVLVELLVRAILAQNMLVSASSLGLSRLPWPPAGP
eukprot:116518-Chlamydomonas_euryale.AAC.2